MKTLILVIALYLGAAKDDGDCLNDWLTHMPEGLRPAIYSLCVDRYN